MKPNFFLKYLLLTIVLASVASCSSSKIQTTKNGNNTNNTSYSKSSNYKKNVVASYYHDKFNGRSTASGEKFNNSKLTAAHKTLAFGTVIKVTNVENNQSVIVTVNDRGPFSKGREIDLSKKAFFEISDKSTHGTLNVDIEIID